MNTLENSQGIGLNLGGLFYAGKLPKNYNIIISDEDIFGQLFYTGSSNVDTIQPYIIPTPIPGSIENFGISSLSTSSLSGPYDAVLVNIIPTSTSGISNGISWTLQKVSAGSTNCKGNIVTIGEINYDSYDLYIGTTPIDYITLISLVPSRAQAGQTINVNFETNIQGLSINNAATIFFNSTTISGFINSITYDEQTGIGKGSVSGSIPIGSGNVPVSLSIETTTSSNSLDFVYTSSPSSALKLTFTGKSGIIDTNNNLFVFTLESFIANTSSNFSVLLNNDITFGNCIFSFKTTDSTNPTTLQSVQLTVTYNSKDYNLIYNPYETLDNRIKTYVTYLNTDGDLITYYPYYQYINGSNPWYFVSSTTSTDIGNEILYNGETDNNYIEAITSDPRGNIVNIQNIGTLGMCGASNAFLKGISSSTENKDTYYGSVAWCFYSLYNSTNGFTA